MSLWYKVIIFCALFLSTIGCVKEETNIQMENVIYEMLVSDDTSIEDFAITDILGDTISIKTLVENNSIVIIGLYNIDCTSCAEREIELLKSIVRNGNNDDIIILGNFSSLRKMKIFHENIPLKMYSDKNSKLLDYIDHDVFIFRLSTDLKAYSIVDLIAYPAISKIYYDAAIGNNRLKEE